MLNKIYAAVLGICILLSLGLTYYSYSWLQSISAPIGVIQNFDYSAHINWIFLWISSLILLVLANVLLWTTRNAWAMWATFLYFAIFILIQKFWLDQSLLSYKQSNNLTTSIVSIGVFLSLLYCLLAAAIVFFNQFIVKRMHDKLIAQPTDISQTQIEDKTDFKENNL